MRIAKLACLVLISTLALNAQGLTGQISGTVQDPSGSAVPGVKIELTNTLTGQVRATAADHLGYYWPGRQTGNPG